MIRTALLLSLLFAACTACAPTATQPGTPAGPDALAQVGRWKLQGATDAAGQPVAAVLPDGKAVHAIAFNDGALAIEGGCNHMGGRYDIDGQGRLVVQEIRSTLMACANPALMSADSAVAGLLQGTSEWSIAESYPEQLFLQHADGRRSHWVAVRPAPSGAPGDVSADSTTTGGDGSGIVLGPLAGADIESASLPGELACSFSMTGQGTLLLAKGDVASSEPSRGVVKVGDYVEMVAAPGGFDAMLGGTRFSGKGKTVTIEVTGPAVGGGESPPNPATLTYDRADGARRQFIGQWRCGP